MITDHSSAGFEFLLQRQPLVRIHRPALIELANIHPDYVDLLASVAESVDTIDEALAAVERGLCDPSRQSVEPARRRRRSVLPAWRRDRGVRSTRSTRSSSSSRRQRGRRRSRGAMPAVSVIMPAYNVAPYIAQTHRVRARADVHATSS